MIYEAKILGASAVLLICSILEQEQLKAYQDLAWELGLSALVEAHTEEEIRMAPVSYTHLDVYKRQHQGT